MEFPPVFVRCVVCDLRQRLKFATERLPDPPGWVWPSCCGNYMQVIRWCGCGQELTDDRQKHCSPACAEHHAAAMEQPTRGALGEEARLRSVAGSIEDEITRYGYFS